MCDAENLFYFSCRMVWSGSVKTLRRSSSVCNWTSTGMCGGKTCCVNGNIISQQNT